VTRRAIVDIVRGAVLGSYGVTGVDAGLLERILGRLGLREPGIRIRLDRGLEIDLHLTVAYGLPVAEVARQVDSAVRYGIRHSLDRDVRRLAVHVGGLRYQPASVPPTKETPPPSDTTGPAIADGTAAASTGGTTLDVVPDDGHAVDRNGKGSAGPPARRTRRRAGRTGRRDAG
jgi:uncharacterized alkaline shock family protein YloU